MYKWSLGNFWLMEKADWFGWRHFWIISCVSFLFISSLFLAIKTKNLVKYYDNDEKNILKKIAIRFLDSFPGEQNKNIWGSTSIAVYLKNN